MLNVVGFTTLRNPETKTADLKYEPFGNCATQHYNKGKQKIAPDNENREDKEQ